MHQGDTTESIGATSGEFNSVDSLPSRLQVDRICREFERQWRAAVNRPRIERFLQRVRGCERSHALRELLATELACRIDAGEAPSPADYQERFPDQCALIETAFDEVAALDQGPEHAWPFQRSLGGYQLIREIGRGGTGVVFEAIHPSSGRHAAVKALLPSVQRDDRRLRRFEQEFQTISQLHHPNIVEVLEHGQQSGVHFFAMQYVDGVSLEKIVADHDRVLVETAAAPPASRRRYRRAVADLISPGRYRRIARIGVQIADSLEYAHQHGVTHRDVKPANILLDEIGQAWLTDFGLARQRGESPFVPAAAGVSGTLRYLAPERFDGDSGPSGDVYGLGLVLYELLTLRPAYDATSELKLFQQIVSQCPRRPRDINADVPEDLEAIVLRAIARKPQRRYANAGELGRDLQRFLELENPQARRTRWQNWNHPWRRLAAHWPLVAIAAVSLVLLFTSLQLACRHASGGVIPGGVSLP